MYNPLIHKKPYGACVKDKDVHIRFPLPIGEVVKNVTIILRKDEQEICHQLKFKEVVANEAIYEGTFQISESGIWKYRFEAELLTGGIGYYGRGFGGIAVRQDWLPEWQLTVCDKEQNTPEWAKQGICYQIFADRFYKGEERPFNKDGTYHKDWNEQLEIAEEGKDYKANDFYGGNIEGIIQKIPYLKELNVTCIYLTPIFESFSNHRYDTADYLKVDDLFGTEEQLSELIQEAHKNGIHIMLDGVFNHTGSDSKYFNKLNRYPGKGAYQSKDSKYYDWYYFIDYPNQYHSWWGCSVVPTVNKIAKGYRELIMGKNGVIEKWSKLGVDAWRLDVVDELPIEFTTALCKKIKEQGKDKHIIGEVWEDATTKVSYDEWRPYLMGNQIDSTMNYPFKEAILEFCHTRDKDVFIEKITNILENYPKSAIDSTLNLIGSHDTVRAITALSTAEYPKTQSARRVAKLHPSKYMEARNRLKIATVLQYTLPGIPMVYYGDEIGMQGYEDPLNRKTMQWDNIDDVIHSRYIKLGELRKKYKEILQGETSFLTHPTLLIYVRKSEQGKMTIAINPTDEEQEFNDKKIGAWNYDIFIKQHV